MILGVIFFAVSALDIISITKTIITNPGNIPEAKEWDMNSDSMATSGEEEDFGAKQSSGNEQNE